MKKIEIVDIVNEENKVLYQASKEEAHQKGLLHRAVISEVIDSRGRWTLVKQASDRQDPGQYVSPVGGHIKAGESVIDALKREAFEELGLKKFAFKFVGRAIFDRFILNRHENHFFMVHEIYTNEVPVLNNESVEFRKFSQTELNELLKNKPKLFGEAFHFVAKNIFDSFTPPPPSRT